MVMNTIVGGRNQVTIGGTRVVVGGSGRNEGGRGGRREKMFHVKFGIEQGVIGRDGRR